MTAPTLFDDWQTEAAATTRVRVTDPMPSQAAAAMTPAQLAPARAEVLEVIGRWRVITRNDAAKYLGRDRSCISRRITDLVEGGYVEAAGVVAGNGRPLTMWALTDEGRKVYERLVAGE